MSIQREALQAAFDWILTVGGIKGHSEVLAKINAALSAPTEQVPAGLLEWAVQQWRREVEHRPLVNKNRRPLDDVWRQVIRFAGGDPEALVGPSHDELLAASPSAPTAVKEAGGVDDDFVGLAHEVFAMAQGGDAVEAAAARIAERLRTAQPATPVAPKTLEALTAEDIPNLWRDATDVPIAVRSGSPEVWYLRGVQDGQRAIATKNGMTLGGGK